MRLGVHLDYVFRSQGAILSTDRAFVLFVTGLAERCEEIVLFGRLDPEPGSSQYSLPINHLRFVGLPHYPRLSSVGALLRSVRKALSTFERELGSLDAVLLFGPHPIALLFAWRARRRSLPVFLGIRQDFPRYVRHRLPSWRWVWALGAAWSLEAAFRLLARTTPTIVLGEQLAEKYRGGKAPVLSTGFSLVRTADVVTPQRALARSWSEELWLLSVGRLDPEKNPLLLLETMAMLSRAQSRWRLRIVGTGPLAELLAGRVEDLGIGECVELLGYVPSGPNLRALYRSSHAFLHVSLTEGLPLVLFEAQAAGLPVVATDVGGVRAALGNGDRGLLVPPDSVTAIVAALQRLEQEEGLRRVLIERGLAHVRSETMDAQLDRLAGFLATNAESHRDAYARAT
jgi:glycosyltransferase involved in cell wall biosynthesis